jgi:hypothetical protein
VSHKGQMIVFVDVSICRDGHAFLASHFPSSSMFQFWARGGNPYSDCKASDKIHNLFAQLLGENRFSLLILQIPFPCDITLSADSKAKPNLNYT